ncbi:cation transporter [Nitrosomonas sp. GH22]|nr:cation transporter [Nitrosomonas sp. GH22]
MVLDSAQRLLNPETLLQPTPIVLLIAALSIVANEGLFHYTIRAARKFNSSLLTANAWHHRSDAISSIVVLIGVTGSLLGLPYLDAFAALGVALMIGKIGWDQTWASIRELIDTGMEPKAAAALKRIIETIDCVRGVHMLRSRRMGGAYLIDVHIVVSERLSVSEGHRIAEYVRLKLIGSHENITNVLVHIDPEDDSVAVLCADLPLRREVLRDLRKAWAADFDSFKLDEVTLHYLNGKVHVDLVCTANAVNANAGQLSQRLQEQAEVLDYIGDVRVYRQC